MRVTPGRRSPHGWPAGQGITRGRRLARRDDGGGMSPRHSSGSGASRRYRAAVLTRGADLVTRRVSLDQERGHVLRSV